MLEANEMKILTKTVDKTKIDRSRNNKSDNPAVSNLLMNGRKEGKENGTSM